MRRTNVEYSSKCRAECCTATFAKRVLSEAFYSQSKFKTMIQVTVDGKTRVIRDKQIHYQTKNDLECTYKNHSIYINKQDTRNEFYVSVKDKTGMYAVQGAFGGDYCRYNIETIEDCLVMCIKNILL